MKKFSLILGVFSIAMLFVSCDEENKNSIDTSKAIRSGNFLESANFEDLSVLNIKNTGNVKSSFKDKVATFEYSNIASKSNTRTTLPISETEISFREPLMVMFSGGTYTLSFEYYFDTDDDLAINKMIQNINMKLDFTPITTGKDAELTQTLPVEIGSGGRDERMKREWSKYEKKVGPPTSEYCYIQFLLKNVSKVEENILHIRNLKFERD